MAQPRRLWHLHPGPSVEEQPLGANKGRWLVPLHLAPVGLSSVLVWKPVRALQFRLPGLASHASPPPWLPQTQPGGEEALGGRRIQGPIYHEVTKCLLALQLWLFISLFENVSHDMHGLLTHLPSPCPAHSPLFF